MQSTYALVKERLCALLKDGAGLDAAPAHIFLGPGAFEASTALPLRLSIAAAPVAARLSRVSGGAAFTLYGVRLVERVTESEGRLCFSLTPSFIEEAASRVNAAFPPPALPARIETRAALALARLLMLARKGEAGADADVDARAKNMVWSALGVLEHLEGGREKALKIRLSLAAEHALSFGLDLELEARMALYDKSGEAAAAAARCIEKGILELEGAADGSKGTHA